MLLEALTINFGWLRTWFPDIPQLWIILINPATVLAVLFPLLLRQRPARLPLVLLIGFAITGGSFGLQFIGLQTASPSAVGIRKRSSAPMT